MLKFVSGVLLGVFAGAFTCEIIKRIKPELAEGAEAKAKEVADRFFTEEHITDNS